MNWEVETVGDKADLTELCKCLADNELHIEERNNQFFLRSIRFNDLSTSEEVVSAGTNILTLLTGSARLALGGKTPITVGSVAKIREDGGRDIFLTITETVGLRAFFSIETRKSNGSIEVSHPAQDVPKWIKLGFSDEKVAKALRLFGTSEHDWVSLCRLYEVIEEDVRTVDEIARRGWATRASIKRFKHTANSPGSTGDASRHGKESTSPPGNPMTLPEGKALIELILHGWLRSKTSNA
ncbi:MAG: hypothetical protein NT178_17695 [Proteobacteria bacterium]|nr:hypothetical protein [Pseudomonadota bacterium]